MQQQDSLIGYVTVVRGSGMQACLTAFEKKSLSSESEPHLIGQIGSYVAIKQARIRVLAIVTEASLEEFNAASSLSSENRAIESKRLVSLIPLGEFSDNGVFQRGVKRFPTPGAEVHDIDDEKIKTIFSKFTGLGFNIGRFSSHQSLEVSLDPSSLFGRHFAILGQSGAGKSWTVTSLLQRAVAAMPKAHIILLDLHGEYIWEGKDKIVHSAFDKDIARYIDARKLEIPYWLMTYSELIDLLIDRSDSAASIQIAFLRDVLYSLKKQAAKELGITNVSIDAPIYFSIIDLCNSFKEANEHRIDFGKTKGSLFGQFDNFLVQLQSRLNDVRYDFLLKPKIRQDSASLSGLLRDFIGLGDPKCQITVIDLSSVPFDVRPSVSAQIGRLAFEFNYWNPRNREFPILLVCEEAHAYIPRDSDSQYDATRKSMERIAKEGRKYGVGLGVVSQRPHELSETVLSQCGSFICLRITNPDDQSYVRDLVPESQGDLTDILTTLGRGEAMVFGEAVPMPIRFQVYRPDPPPNSNDVDFQACWTAGPDDLDVDGIIDRWRRQGQ